VLHLAGYIKDAVAPRYKTLRSRLLHTLSRYCC
jgi:hypothetical protein